MDIRVFVLLLSVRAVVLQCTVPILPCFATFSGVSGVCKRQRTACQRLPLLAF